MTANPSDRRDPQPRWSREQIRDARLAPLEPILRRRGLRLIDRGGGNLELADRPGLILKDATGAGPNTNWSRACGTIDFHTQILGLSFHQAMKEITGT